MIVTEEYVAQFVSQRIGVALCPPYTCMGFKKDGLLMGGVIFNGWEARNVHVTVAGSGWTRSFIKAVGEYVFGQMDCLRMTVTTAQQEVAEYGQRLGGMIEAEMEDYYGEGQTAMQVGVLRKNWPFAIETGNECG